MDFTDPGTLKRECRGLLIKKIGSTTSSQYPERYVKTGLTDSHYLCNLMPLLVLQQVRLRPILG